MEFQNSDFFLQTNCESVALKIIDYLLQSNDHRDFFVFRCKNSDAKSHEFSREPSVDWTINAVDSNMFSTAGDVYAAQIRPKLWAAVNDEINPNECEIYRCDHLLGISIEY